MPAKRGAALSHADPDPDASDGSARASRTKLIARITAALGLPPKAVFRPGRAADDRTRALAETAELLRLFDQIDDRQARQDCLAYVRAALEGTRTRPAGDRADGPRA